MLDRWPWPLARRSWVAYDTRVDPNLQRMPKVAVIGGGISGLAAAHQLNQLRPDWPVVLFEASSRLGGVIETIHQSGYLIERAADNFLRGPTAPWAERLCQTLGFAEQLIPTSEKNRRAQIVWRGQLYPVPAGFQLMAPARFWPILTSRLLSPCGRLRLCLEPLVREPREPQDECLRQFASRRLGREAFERLVQPLVSGIYTADPDRLSVGAALPHMLEMVRQHGSLYRAMRHRRRQLSSQTRGATLQPVRRPPGRDERPDRCLGRAASPHSDPPFVAGRGD